MQEDLLLKNKYAANHAFVSLIRITICNEDNIINTFSNQL